MAAPAAAETIVLDPLDAQAETQDGSNWVVTDGGQSINASRFSGIPLERRGILEFPLTALPNDATILSATIAYSVNNVTGAGPVIQFHGYPGNGILEVADATVPFNQVGVSPALSSLIRYTNPINSAYIESLLGSNTHLGLMTYQQTIGTQGAFWSVEGAGLGATLTIEYIPEPASLCLLLCCIGLLPRGRRL
jgi:hypothetical protein